MPYQSLTLTDLQTRLKARWDGVPYWTDAEATLYLNEGLLFWGMLTGRWKARVVLGTTAGTYDYALPSTMVYQMRITFNGYPLSPSSRFDLDNGRPNWRRETTASGGDVPTRPTLWAPVTLALFYLWPADAAGHNALTVDGVSATPTLVNAGDYVDLAEADVSLLLGYALHAAAYKKGGAWFRATMPYLTAFLQAAALENELLTTSQAFRRYLGLDKRDLKPPADAPSSLAQVIAADIQPPGA